MKASLIEKGIPALFALAGLLALGHWWLMAQRLPALHERPLIIKQKDTAVRPTGDASAQPASATVSALPEVPAAATAPTIPHKHGKTAGNTTASASTSIPCLPGAWPAFRGSNRDGCANVQAPLARAWGAQGPKKLWSVTLGEGYAGAAVLNSRVYVLDYDMPAQQDVLRCFTLADGKELWHDAYPSPVGKQHGISRTVPALTDRYVVAFGPRCQVYCVDALSGKKLWTHNLVKEYGATIPEWNAAQCPLIDGNRVIIAPGDKALLVAFDCATGKTLWETPNPNGWKMTHSSIMPIAFNRQRMYVCCYTGGVAGFTADGKLSWQTSDWIVHTANIPTPVPVGNGLLLLSGGYGAGCMLLRLKEDGEAITTQTVFRLKEAEFGAYQQTPIFYRGYLYGVIPSGQLACLDMTGAVRWKSGNASKFAWNPYVLVSGVIYVLNDHGTLTMVEATPSGYQELAHAPVLPDGTEFWAPMAVAGQRLLLRDLTHLVCVNIGK